MLKVPKASRIPHPHHIHDDTRQDDYYWLRDKENPDVIGYLEEENKYYADAMRPLEPLTNQIFEQMVARIPDQEIKVPVQSDQFYYTTRMEKELQYPIYVRQQASTRSALTSAPEEILLNLNDLSKDGGYLSVTVQRLSPDGTRLAYLENRDGTDKYTLFIKDIATGELLADRVANIFIHRSLEWDATGEYLFYIVVNDSQRPFQLWRHRVCDTSADTLLYEETDNTYTISLHKSRSGQFLFVTSATKTTSEIRFLSDQHPLESFQLFDARRPGIKYQLEHWGNDFLLLTNEDAQNFRLARCSIQETVPEARQDLFPYDDNRYLRAVHPFLDGLILEGRENGLTEIWMYESGALTKLIWDEPLYNVSMGENRSYETTEVLVQYESLLTPQSTFSIHFGSDTRTCLQVATVPGEYVPSDYHQERLWATADDGTRVPMTVVYRTGAIDTGPAPLLLYGYGSYGLNSDAHFDPQRLPLLDMGVVFVTAQIRGGSEMGYHWYADGKLLNKRNTFTDFIAAAKDLIARGYTSPSKLVARGGSAGGLLVGAVANMAPELFQVIAPAVPFVDVMTTMLDASIPLTTLEYDEWGNPEDPAYYAYMKLYSPYDNVEAKDYPHLLVTTGLNDPRVAYWEPAKWVARLREMKTDNHTLVLKTNMGAGHFGASGRFDHMKEIAANYAFILDKLGITAN